MNKNQDTIRVRIKRWLARVPLREKRQKDLDRYRQEKHRLEELEEDALELEYINTIAKYEHKKGIMSIFVIFILVAILMKVWKYFFSFIEKIILYLTSSNGDTDIAIVTFVIYATIIASITAIILSMLVAFTRSANRLNKHLLIIKEVRNFKNEREVPQNKK